MPKGFFLQNPVYMTDLSSLLLRVRTTSLRDQTRKRGYPIGGVATGMLEKAEPMEWYGMRIAHFTSCRSGALGVLPGGIATGVHAGTLASQARSVKMRQSLSI